MSGNSQLSSIHQRSRFRVIPSLTLRVTWKGQLLDSAKWAGLYVDFAKREKSKFREPKRKCLVRHHVGQAFS